MRSPYSKRHRYFLLNLLKFLELAEHTYLHRKNHFTDEGALLHREYFLQKFSVIDWRNSQ